MATFLVPRLQNSRLLRQTLAAHARSFSDVTHTRNENGMLHVQYKQLHLLGVTHAEAGHAATVRELILKEKPGYCMLELSPDGTTGLISPADILRRGDKNRIIRASADSGETMIPSVLNLRTKEMRNFLVSPVPARLLDISINDRHLIAFLQKFIPNYTEYKKEGDYFIHVEDAAEQNELFSALQAVADIGGIGVFGDCPDWAVNWRLALHVDNPSLLQAISGCEDWHEFAYGVGKNCTNWLRERYMAAVLREMQSLSEERPIMAVMGEDHLKGVLRHLMEFEKKNDAHGLIPTVLCDSTTTLSKYHSMDILRELSALSADMSYEMAVAAHERPYREAMKELSHTPNALKEFDDSRVYPSLSFRFGMLCAWHSRTGFDALESYTNCGFLPPRILQEMANEENAENTIVDTTEILSGSKFTNLFLVANQMAEIEEEPLSAEHFETVYSIATADEEDTTNSEQQFEEGMKDVEHMMNAYVSELKDAMASDDDTK